jgi:archaellum component FlaC
MAAKKRTTVRNARPRRASARTAASDAAEARFLVLMEDVRSRMSGIGEGVLALGERMDRFEARVEQRFDRVEGRLDRVEADVAVLKTDVRSLKDDVSMLKADVSVLTLDVALVKQASLENAESIRQLASRIPA